MDAHSVFRSPPAVAALIFLALVVGTVFAVRATMGSDGDTDVAGTVIERSEEPSEFVETPQDEPREPIIVRPRPDREVAQDEPARQAAPAPAPVVPADPVDEQVGLIRDEPAPVVVVPDADADADSDVTPRQPRSNRDRDPDPVDPEPDPEPTRRPEPRPDPEPEPEPEPEPQPEPDTTKYELREGDGISEDTARSEDPGNSGKYNWEFVSLASHDNQDGATARSRKAMARVFVGFSEATTASKEPVRDFRCDALVTAGSRRLITDRDHFFEIQMWTTDGYALQDRVSSVFVREAMDLAPGEQRTLEGTLVPDQQAAEGLNYTCTVEYRER